MSHVLFYVWLFICWNNVFARPHDWQHQAALCLGNLHTASIHFHVTFNCQRQSQICCNVCRNVNFHYKVILVFNWYVKIALNRWDFALQLLQIAHLWLYSHIVKSWSQWLKSHQLAANHIRRRCAPSMVPVLIWLGVQIPGLHGYGWPLSQHSKPPSVAVIGHQL